MIFTKYAAVIALITYVAFASEIVYKIPSTTITFDSDKPKIISEAQEDRLLKAPIAKSSFSNIPDVAYYNIFSYLDLSEINNLLLTDKSFNKAFKEWIKIFLISFSPNLDISDSDSYFNLVIYSFINSIFPGIKSIKDSRAQFYFNLAENKYSENENIHKSSSREMKNIMLAFFQNI